MMDDNGDDEFYGGVLVGTDASGVIQHAAASAGRNYKLFVNGYKNLIDSEV